MMMYLFVRTLDSIYNLSALGSYVSELLFIRSLRSELREFV